MTTNENTQKNQREWTDSFILDGITYYCQHVNPHPLHRMGGVIMDLGREEYVSSDGGDRLLVLPPKSKIPVVAFVIHTIDKYQKPETSEPVLVAIYRKGESVPIFLKEYTEYSEDIVDMLSEYDITPGEYVLALGNIAPYDHLCDKFEKVGDYFVFRMQVIEHGEHLQHPILLNATINEEHIISLLFHYFMDITDELIECECYDEDYRLVGLTEKMPTPNVFSTDVMLKLKEKVWWLDGGYHLIIYHNHEPFAHIRFVSQGKENEVVWTENLSSNSIYYKLCKDVEQSGKKYMFCLLDGCGKLKKKVLDYLCMDPVNANEHLMFAASGKPDFEVMHAITGVLHPRYGFYAKPVKQLMKEVNKATDPKETMDVKMARNNYVLYGLDILMKPENEGFARLLLEVAAARHGFIVLYGTPDELQRLLKMYPEWTDYLMTPSWWNVYDYTERDSIRTVERILKNKNLTANWSARNKLEQVINENWDTIQFWRKADYERWIGTEVISRIKQRIFSENSFSQLFMQTVLEEDISLTAVQPSVPQSFGYSLSGLERMVGLNEVKEHLALLLKRLDFDSKREKLGLRKLRTGRPHMVFTGNPGTGKTTVAKLIGQAFKHLGYLSGGDVITVDRSQLVGRHIGETESRMTQILKNAKGHVLFIDEAYSLCDNQDGDRKDFGCRALECLLPILAEADSDIIVILAGYEKEMNDMMALNPGMKGRFPFWFKFEDYNRDELYEIALRLLQDNDYRLTERASEKLRICIGEALKVKDRYFHNARWVNQLVQDGILAMMAERLYGTDADVTNLNLFRTVTEDDVSKGYKLMRTDKKSLTVRKVGFR